jgi:hypothetical protein
MNLTTASVNPATLDAGKEDVNALQSTAPSLSLVKARGFTPSDQDVSQFQQALSRAEDEGADQKPGSEILKDVVGATLSTKQTSTTAPMTAPEDKVGAVNKAQTSAAEPMTVPVDKAIAVSKAQTSTAEAMTAPEDKVIAVNQVQTSTAEPLPAPKSASDTPASAAKEAAPLDPLSAPMSARMRWMERRRSSVNGAEDLESSPQVDETAPVVLAPDARLAQLMAVAQADTKTSTIQPAQTAATPVPFANGFGFKSQADMPDVEPHDASVKAQVADIDPSQVPSGVPLSSPSLSIKPASEVPSTPVDTAWVSRTVQDTVRATLKTLAQRDLESLDAGRPVQITLDQGQLRGAQLTLEAKEGLLEISVSTSQAQLRATLEAQQDALAQGLLRDVGAVRWVGLQDVMPAGSTSNDTSSTGSFNSQQGSQGNGSERQNQRQNLPADFENMALPEAKVDKGQVIADAQSLRAFLGL